MFNVTVIIIKVRDLMWNLQDYTTELYPDYTQLNKLMLSMICKQIQGKNKEYQEQ